MIRETNRSFFANVYSQIMIGVIIKRSELSMFLLTVKHDVRLPDAPAATNRLPCCSVCAAGDQSAPDVQD